MIFNELYKKNLTGMAVSVFFFTFALANYLI